MINKATKVIATTTINSPTIALKKFLEIAKRDGWVLVISGDKKTPHEDYWTMEADNPDHVIYLGPDKQEKDYPKLSELIGWNCIQRRNFSIIEAYRLGAEVVAVVDDDNIPYDHWGQNLSVGKTSPVRIFNTRMPVYDPLMPMGQPVWHRGFPVQLLPNRAAEGNRPASEPTVEERKVLVQADLWDGDPDVDAICRISFGPDMNFNPLIEPYSSNKPMPFNSQNTFLHRSVIPSYFLFPHIGRMDDIWAAYVVQRQFPNCVVFNRASVRQERNPHDLTKDLEAEVLGYRNTLDLVTWLFEQQGDPMQAKNWPAYMPKEALQAFDEYRRIIGESEK